MVVFDSDLLGALNAPGEGDAPLIVDADGVLALAISLQGVKSVGGRETQGFEGVDGGKFTEFAKGFVLNARRQLARALAVPDSLGFLVRETLNHAANVEQFPAFVNIVLMKT